jgi:hypothetical protein
VPTSAVRCNRTGQGARKDFQTARATVDARRHDAVTRARAHDDRQLLHRMSTAPYIDREQDQSYGTLS